jgi:aerobic-type carbon monoxide dehydrogenase small subunit (CoxS/CutS family)
MSFSAVSDGSFSSFVGARMSHRIEVNGELHEVDAAPDTPLLYVLRNDLGLNGPKFGCGLGQCGACAAIVGGKLTRTCSIALQDVAEDKITTLEALGPWRSCTLCRDRSSTSKPLNAGTAPTA